MKKKLQFLILITILTALASKIYTPALASEVDKTFNAPYSKERLEGSNMCTYYYSNKDVLQAVNCIPMN